MLHSSPFPLLTLLLLLWLHACPVLAEDPVDSAEQDDTAEQDTRSDTTSSDIISEAATPSSAAQPPRATPQMAARRHQSIINHLSLYQRQREVVQLVATDDAFNGLFIQETMGKPQGGVLLLHDNEQHGHWPTVTGPLREYLPEYGWSTLAIELPYEPPAQLPERPVYRADTATDELGGPDANGIDSTEQDNQAQTDEALTDESTDNRDNTGPALSGTPDASGGNPPPPGNATENTLSNEPALPRLNGLPELDRPATADTASETADVSPREQYQQQMRARIDAAMRYLNSRGQLNLVMIANGSSTSWAVDFLLNKQQSRADGEPLKGYTLVMVDARQNPYNQLYLEDQLAQLDIPVLDLVTDYPSANYSSANYSAGGDSTAQYSNHQRRAGVMRQRQRKQYRQIEMQAPDMSSYQHHALKRRIRGWLKTHAAGTELPAGNKS